MAERRQDGCAGRHLSGGQKNAPAGDWVPRMSCVEKVGNESHFPFRVCRPKHVLSRDRKAVPYPHARFSEADKHLVVGHGGYSDQLLASDRIKSAEHTLTAHPLSYPIPPSLKIDARSDAVMLQRRQPAFDSTKAPSKVCYAVRSNHNFAGRQRARKSAYRRRSNR